MQVVEHDLMAECTFWICEKLVKQNGMEDEHEASQYV